MRGCGRERRIWPPDARYSALGPGAECGGGSASTGGKILQAAPGGGVTSKMARRLLQNDMASRGSPPPASLPPRVILSEHAQRPKHAWMRTRAKDLAA